MTVGAGRASLFMYDMPEFRRATESWWMGLSRAMTAEGIDGVPTSLADLSGPGGTFDAYDIWARPDLLFSQTCGYPLTHDLAGKVTVVATPGYDCEGCRGSRYSSVILVRADDPAAALSDLRGRRAVVNSFDSQSGFSALRIAVAPLTREGRFFGRVAKSGGHMASVEAVAAGTADVCAVDAVTFALAERYRPSAVRGLRILSRSPEAPGLPYVTAGGVSDVDLRRLRAALFSAIEDPELAATRAALLIAGAEVLPDDAYGRILELENQAIALGYGDVA